LTVPVSGIDAVTLSEVLSGGPPVGGLSTAQAPKSRGNKRTKRTFRPGNSFTEAPFRVESC